MNCKEKLKKLMAAVEKELATTPAYDMYHGKNWEKDDDGWRADDYGVFMDESESWVNIKKVFVEVEREG